MKPSLQGEFMRAERSVQKLAATKAVLAEREEELLALKGPCTTPSCRLHYAHAGPCDVMPGGGSVPPVAKPPMVMRSFRVRLRLWEEAKAKADEREENISDVIREALERYVTRK